MYFPIMTKLNIVQGFGLIVAFKGSLNAVNEHAMNGWATSSGLNVR